MMNGIVILFLCKQKTAYEMRISDWSSDVFSSDLAIGLHLSRQLPADRRRATEEGRCAGVGAGHSCGPHCPSVLRTDRWLRVVPGLQAAIAKHGWRSVSEGAARSVPCSRQ